MSLKAQREWRRSLFSFFVPVVVVATRQIRGYRLADFLRDPTLTLTPQAGRTRRIPSSSRRARENEGGQEREGEASERGQNENGLPLRWQRGETKTLRVCSPARNRAVPLPPSPYPGPLLARGGGGQDKESSCRTVKVLASAAQRAHRRRTAVHFFSLLRFAARFQQRKRRRRNESLTVLDLFFFFFRP